MLAMTRSIAVALMMQAIALPLSPAMAEPPRPAERASAIDLDLHRADLRNVLRLLADVGGVNLVYGEEVSGEVTLRLRAVPWEQALRMIVASKGLEMEREDGIVRVARAETFAKERQAEIDARTLCLQSAPLRTELISVRYARAQDLLPHVRARLTPRGTVAFDQRTNTLIVSDVECD
jgi:type II secretory pathway component HofQ